LKKRFTDCHKWSDPWFRQLSPTAKLLWQWILDSCDNAGVLDPDWGLATFQVGSEVEGCIEELKTRLEPLENKRIFVTKFIGFQYPSLSWNCAAHKPVFASLEKHNLWDRLPGNLIEDLREGDDTLSETFLKVTGRGKRKGKRNRNGNGQEEPNAKSATSFPTVKAVQEFARQIPCADECAVAYHADRSSINWTKVKGGIQVVIEDWRNDLRTFALHWRNNEAERKRKEAAQGKPVTKAVDTKPRKVLEL
jgi:hypothetical protein